MANIERPILPPRLYRYRHIRDKASLKRELDVILTGRLWFSDFTMMNDPMEGFYRPTDVLRGLPSYKRIVHALRIAKTRVGMCCFSETDDNELMWSHYAERYSGICIGYNAKRLLAAMPNYVRLVKLSYVHVPPQITAAECKADLEAATRKLLSQKKSSWAYEREWRALGNPTLTGLTGEDELVSVVRLGSRMHPHNEKQIVSVLAKTDIKIYAMKVSGYEHSWKRVGGAG